MVAGLDLARMEEAALNALQAQQRMLDDGWLLRVSPGKYHDRGRPGECR